MIKKLIIPILFCSMAYGQNEAKSNIIIRGVAIFIESEPLKEYKNLETERHRVSWYPDPSKDFEKIVKKVLKRYPNADGLIFRLNKKRRCDIIEFVEN